MQDLMKLTKKELEKLTKKNIIDLIEKEHEKKETPSTSAVKAFKGDSEASLVIRQALLGAIEEIKENGLKLERPHFHRYQSTAHHTLRSKRDEFMLVDRKEGLDIGLQHLAILIEKEVARLG